MILPPLVKFIFHLKTELISPYFKSTVNFKLTLKPDKSFSSIKPFICLFLNHLLSKHSKDISLVILPLFNLLLETSFRPTSSHPVSVFICTTIIWPFSRIMLPVVVFTTKYTDSALTAMGKAIPANSVSS